MFADIRHLYVMLDQGGGAAGNGGLYFGNQLGIFLSERDGLILNLSEYQAVRTSTTHTPQQSSEITSTTPVVPTLLAK